MIPLKPEVILPIIAIQANKHRAFVKVQAAIIQVALSKVYFSPADIPEDIVCEADRQGCCSNGWSVLRSLEIIERVPMDLNNEALKIFGGRTRNTNLKSKGRFVSVYRLRSRALALCWLERNGQATPARQVTATQQELC